MRELEEILRFWRGDSGRFADAILATVVHVKRSAYRRPGARMLILPDGGRIGTISGGCLESSVAQKADWWTSTTGTAVRQFDTTQTGAAWEFGLGCNGVITILLERGGNTTVQETLAFLDDLRVRRGAGIVATVIRTDNDMNHAVGERLFLEASIPRGGELLGSASAAPIIDAAGDVSLERRSRLVHHDGMDVFIEWIEPPPHLVIFGAGHDVIPVNELAQMLGWNVTIADNRPGYTRPERFPGADRVIALSPAADISQVGIAPRSAVVVMTHNYPLDRILLPQILERGPGYLGLLGPRSRAEQLFREIDRNADEYDVHAPVGLDLGGEGPQSIALSIVAEIQSILNARPSGPLRNRANPIHSAPLEVTVGSKIALNNMGIGVSSEPVSCETFLARHHA